jgi:hypothetical protein
MSEQPEPIAVDSGVERPDSRYDTRSTVYPFRAMAVDDSFFVAFTEDRTDKATRTRLYGAVAWANKRHAPHRFSQRTVEGGVRVWRVE